MAEPVKIEQISAVFQKEIKAQRPGVLATAKAFGLARQKVKDIAPKVIGLFKRLQVVYEALTFIDFVRMMDPSVPQGARDTDGVKGYQNHPTYTAIRYMQTVLTGRARGPQRVGAVSAGDQLARSLATILQVVKDPTSVWAAVQKEFNLEERGLARLQKRVAATKALIDLSSVKPIERAKVIHMDTPAPAAGNVPGQRATTSAANLAAMRGTLAGVGGARRRAS